MDVFRQRHWIAALALAAMLASPLAALLCCRVLAHDHDVHGHHGHAAQAHAPAAGESAEAAGPVARPPDHDCPLVELPPAKLAADPAPSHSPSAPLVVALAEGRGASLQPAPPSASLELRSRAPPHVEGRIFIRTCSLLI